MLCRADVVNVKVSWSPNPVRVVAWTDGNRLHVQYHPHDAVSVNSTSIGSDET